MVSSLIQLGALEKMEKFIDTQTSVNIAEYSRIPPENPRVAELQKESMKRVSPVVLAFLQMLTA